MLPSQLISAAIPEVRVSPWVRTACLNSWLPASARPAIAQATNDRSSDQRPGDRDLELGPGGVRVLLEPGEAAEQPQRDRGDADVVAPGHEGVAELVEQDRAEEEHGARDREQIRRGVTRGGVEDVAVEAGEPEDDQEEDHEPGVVHRDPDAPDAKQCDATAGHASDVREGELVFRDGHGGCPGNLGPARLCLDAETPRGALRVSSAARPPKGSDARRGGWRARCATPAPQRCASRRSRWPTAHSGGRSACWQASARWPAWPPVAAGG